jgi:hypothetical protein
VPLINNTTTLLGVAHVGVPWAQFGTRVIAGWMFRLYDPCVIHSSKMIRSTTIQNVSETSWISFPVIVPIAGFIRLEILAKCLGSIYFRCSEWFLPDEIREYDEGK